MQHVVVAVRLAAKTVDPCIAVVRKPSRPERAPRARRKSRHQGLRHLQLGDGMEPDQSNSRIEIRPPEANAALWAALDKWRGYRSLLIARTAHVLNAAAGEEDWRSFAATAAAPIDAAALQTLPVMEHVLDTSLAA